jgi:hypothetical protein
MKWILIYIIINPASIEVHHGGTFDGMTQCFTAREELRIDVSDTEHFPVGQQAVCIRAEVD